MVSRPTPDPPRARSSRTLDPGVVGPVSERKCERQEGLAMAVVCVGGWRRRTGLRTGSAVVQLNAWLVAMDGKKTSV